MSQKVRSGGAKKTKIGPKLPKRELTHPQTTGAFSGPAFRAVGDPHLCAHEYFLCRCRRFWATLTKVVIAHLLAKQVRVKRQRHMLATRFRAGCTNPGFPPGLPGLRP
jgi:hypothetical protein